MNRNHRRVLGVLSIGGGFLGVAIGLSKFAVVSGFFNYIFILVFVGFYIFGIVSGVLLIESDSYQAIKWSSLYWLIQVPIVMSPLLGYQFASGLILNVWLATAGGSGWYFSLGSAFGYSMFESFQPWSIGVNIVALLVTVYLYKVKRYLSIERKEL